MNDISRHQDDSSIFDSEDFFSEDSPENSDISISGNIVQLPDGQAQDGDEDNKTIETGRDNKGEVLAKVLEQVDGELERLASREVLPATEVTDLLLDLRFQLAGAVSENS